MSVLKAFSTQMENLSNELCELFPTDVNLKTINNTIILLKKTNPRKLLDFFNLYVLKYEQKIKSNNESFFLEKNYKEDIDDFNKNSVNIITCLKTYWKDLTKQSKTNIWLYLNVLLKLSKKI